MDNEICEARMGSSRHTAWVLHVIRFGLDALPANPRNRRAIIIGGSPPIWELLEARARRDRRPSNFASSPKSAV